MDADQIAPIKNQQCKILFDDEEEEQGFVMGENNNQMRKKTTQKVRKLSYDDREHQLPAGQFNP